MSIEQLITEHLDIWTAADNEKKSGRGRSSGSAGSVYGIKKLRELILELAVRGKLVPQDASDEPASELLKRIAAEKAKLVAEGKIKKSKPLAEITDDEKPFNSPPNWEWVRLGVIGDWGAGATPLRSISSYYGGEIPWFKSGELSADFIDTSEESITDLALKECSLRLNKPGDVLLAMYGATIGKSAILKISATTNQAVCACTPYTGIWNEYLLVLLKAMKSNFVGQGAGGAQPNISREKIIATVTTLPPLAEQHRIVAKVDELMVLCDQLENQHNNAAEAHEKLVTHLLGTLTQSQNAEDFNTHWQRISEHFDTLFTTEASIDALKQTLLQLAVMGKLVPQDPNDEPASELLKRIQAEKAKLIAEGKIKKDKPLTEISEEEKLFELPVGWVQVRLNELLSKIGAGSTPLGGKQVYATTGIPFLRSQNVWNEGLRLDDVAYIIPETHQKMSGTHVSSFDLLFNITGASIGRCAIVHDNFDTGNVSQHVVIIRSVSREILQFLHLVLISNYIQEKVMDVQVGVSREGLSIGKLGQFIIPIPSLSEQIRIVRKVEELMAICNQLKSSITEG
ncbi:MAG: restriction endonuclease subunit S, partial [Methylococcaceae bacterium]